MSALLEHDKARFGHLQFSITITISGAELLDANVEDFEVGRFVRYAAVGESMTIGGGAFAATTLVRVA